jgi:hypothetical protein
VALSLVRQQSLTPHSNRNRYNMEFKNSIPLRYMEPVTLVLGLAAIIGTGALTKIGENITDKLTQHVKNYDI